MLKRYNLNFYYQYNTTIVVLFLPRHCRNKLKLVRAKKVDSVCLGSKKDNWRKGPAYSCSI